MYNQFMFKINVVEGCKELGVKYLILLRITRRLRVLFKQGNLKYLLNLHISIFTPRLSKTKIRRWNQRTRYSKKI